MYRAAAAILATLLFLSMIVIGLAAIPYPASAAETPAPAPAAETTTTQTTEAVKIPYSGDFSAKTYMDYRKITNKHSTQYKYIHSDEITITEDGFLQTADGYTGAALGSYFGPIGSKYIFTLDSGIVLKLVKVEAKSDAHTCAANFAAGSNDVIELVIDTAAEYMQANVYSNGLVWQGNFNNCPEFTGNIVKIEKVTQ